MFWSDYILRLRGKDVLMVLRYNVAKAMGYS